MNKLNEKGEFIVNTSKKPPKINCTPEELRELFINQDKSYGDIAKIFKCSKEYVKITLRKYGIRKVDDNGNKIDYSKAQQEVIKEKVEESGSHEIITPEVPKDNKKFFKDLVTENKGDIKNALFDYCYYNNLFYDDRVVQEIVDKGEDSVFFSLPEYYETIINQTPKYKNITFKDQLKRENFSKIYSEDLSLLALSEDDRKNRQQIITIIGYDPFKDDSDEDRPQMYRDLTGLITEDLRKDIAKQRAAIEIIRNYSTLGHYQKQVSILMKSGKTDEGTREQIDSLLEMISKIQKNINSTTKENGFTAGKSVGNNGRGILSDVMNQVELGYDNGITNFYDQATSKSIEEVAGISFKAMLSQVRLTGTDYAEILEQQAKIVKDAQEKARIALEACRLAKEKITKEKLLNELEGEYRKRGIQETEIQEFIDREYKMFDPKEK